jgi:hypothetical protein
VIAETCRFSWPERRSVRNTENVVRVRPRAAK